MSRYSQDIKRIAVQRFLQGKQSIGHIAQQLEIESSALRKWIRHYQQQGYKALTKKYSHYSPQFKRNVLHYMRAQGISYQQAAAVFDIRNPSSIAQWARQYDTDGLAALTPKPRGRPPMARKLPAQKPDSELTHEELLKELEYLRAENAFLKKYDALLRKEEAAQNKKRTSSKD